MILDYQVVRIASPAADIFYLVFNCVNYETRKHHYHEWLEHYYQSLEKFLSYFGLKVDYVYPRNKFNKDLTNNAKLSLAVAAFVSKELASEGNSNKPDNTNIEIKNIECNKYGEKVEGLIRSCIDFGYL